MLVAITLKTIDFGMTVYDTYQAYQNDGMPAAVGEIAIASMTSFIPGSKIASRVGRRIGMNIPKATKFASAKHLRQHWKKHGGEWGGKMTESQYLARAKKFLSESSSKDIVEYLRNDGSLVRYSRRTGEFGVCSSDGTINTLFRPAMSRRGGDGLSYFMNDRFNNIGK